MSTNTEKITVKVDADMEELIPEYLDGREKELAVLRTALADGDLEQIRRIGHSLKGSGGGYGFDLLSEIGAELEKIAKQTDKEVAIKAIDNQLGLLADYLKRVDVEYVEIDDD